MAQCVIVEGVGGWAVPLSSTLMQADLVRALNMPVILVVGLRLGCINHALLSARAIRADGCALAGWIGNRIDVDMTQAEGNLATLRERLPAPCLGVIPLHGESRSGATCRASGRGPRLALHMNLMPAKSTRTDSVILALIALLVFVGYVWCFYPGAMSPDSADAWWMARGGTSNNVHGVGLMWLWRVTDGLVPGPGPIFLLQLVLFWGGLLSIAFTLRTGLHWRAIFLLISAGAPVCFVMFSHVWSDVALMAALTAAFASLLRYRDRGRWIWLAAALALLLWSLTLRHNALPAVLPFFGYAGYLWNLQQSENQRLSSRVRSVLVTCAALILLLASMAFDRSVDRRISALPTLSLWDLTAISLKTGSVLLPAGSHGPGLTLDDLRQAFESYSNVSVFTQTHAGIHEPFLDAADPLNGEIREAWFDAIRDHPQAYFSHRWRLTRALFGTHRREWPRELVYFDGETAYRTNPPVAPNATAAHAFWIRAFDAARDTVALAAWPYLVLAVVAAIVAWRRRATADAKAALAVLSSGLLYAAPLPFIAPSAELRYLGWTCLAAILGAALAFTVPRDKFNAAAYRPAP